MSAELLSGAADTVLFDGAAGSVSRGALRAQVAQLAGRLPAAPQLVNLCEDRAHFAVALATAAARRMQVLLPPSRDRSGLDRLLSAHPDAITVSDPGCRLLPEDPARVFEIAAAEPGADAAPIPVEHDNPALTAFTSGSTGEPRAMHKTWRTLDSVAEMMRRRFWSGASEVPGMIATVPPQHMYGLECSVLMPLFCGWRVNRSMPFFPAELTAAAAQQPGTWLLVTTPVHLRALVAAGKALPGLDRVISATAPLDRELADAAERTLGAPVMEIYGCTETGAIATRETGRGVAWQLYDGIRIRADGNGGVIESPHLATPERLPDLLNVVSDTEFEFVGRPSDMIKVGGKRFSAAELERRIREIDGVQDVAIVVPEAASGREARPAALVVAPTLGAGELRAAMAERMDAVLLPRPLRLIDHIPRNATGKVSRPQLLELLRLRR